MSLSEEPKRKPFTRPVMESQTLELSSSWARATPGQRTANATSERRPQSATCRSGRIQLGCARSRATMRDCSMMIPSTEYRHPKTARAAADPPAQPGVPDPGRRLWGGSGRFCGAVPAYRFIQESGYPGNNGAVGQVEDVPVEVDRLRRDVEQNEIGHPRVQERVDRIADRPPDNEAERHGG